MNGSHVVAVDVGGTNVRLGMIREDGEVIRRRRTKIPEATGASMLYQALSDRILAFMASNGNLPAPKGVALGFAGPTDSSAGYVYCAPNVGGLVDLSLGRSLQRLLGLPVLVANDANCAALGEFWCGAGMGARSLFMFTLGTGVGGSLVIGGDIWEGEWGIAGEIGHTVIDAGGPKCNCGKRGCLEALASGTAIVRDYIRRAGIRSPGKRKAITAKAVFERAKQGDGIAKKVVADAARALGIGIANVFNLINPELILIGGGISRAGATLIKPAAAHARELVFPPLKHNLKVRKARLGDDAGLLGAAYLAFRRAGW
jgi:glucokinase